MFASFESINVHTMGRGEAGSKVLFTAEQWESRLAGVKVSKEDMNRLVMNYLVTEGYVEAARMFEEETGTSPGVELSTITDRMQIRQAVQSGDVEAAIDKVNDLDPEILEHQPPLLFHLHQQRLIELIRAGKTQEALDFACEFLAPAGAEDPDMLEELERTVALLAFTDPASSPLSDLMGGAQRQKTASELNAAVLAAQNQEREPRLHRLLKLLLWSQAQLDERAVYPRVTDLATARLVHTKADA